MAAWARSGSDDGGATDGTGDTGGSGAHANGAVAGRGDGDGSSGDSCSRSSDGGGGGGRGFALGDARPGPAVDQLLPLVRFPLMEAQELAGLEAHPLTQNSAVLGELLEEARKVHAAEAAQQQRHTPRAAAPGSQVGMAVCYFQHSGGFCQFLMYHERRFCVAARLSNCRSSPESCFVNGLWACSLYCWRLTKLQQSILAAMYGCAGAGGAAGGGGHAARAAAHLLCGSGSSAAAAAAACRRRAGAHVPLQW